MSASGFIFSEGTLEIRCLAPRDLITTSSPTDSSGPIRCVRQARGRGFDMGNRSLPNKQRHPTTGARFVDFFRRVQNPSSTRAVGAL